MPKITKLRLPLLKLCRKKTPASFFWTRCRAHRHKSCVTFSLCIPSSVTCSQLYTFCTQSPASSFCGPPTLQHCTTALSACIPAYTQWRFYVGAGGAIAPPVFGFAPPVCYATKAVSVITVNNITLLFSRRKRRAYHSVKRMFFSVSTDGET